MPRLFVYFSIPSMLQKAALSQSSKERTQIRSCTMEGKEPSLCEDEDTRTPFQFAEDARRREKGLPRIIRPRSEALMSAVDSSAALKPAIAVNEKNDLLEPAMPDPPSESTG